MKKTKRDKIITVLIISFLILNTVSLFSQISVRTSDSTKVNNGDTIEPIGFQGVHLISSPEYRTITVKNDSGSSITINSITIDGDPDFTVNDADSGLNLWEKRPLVVNNVSVASGSTFEFQLNYCPLSGGDRSATVTIKYNSGTFSFTVKGRGRPEEFTEFSNGSLLWHKIWGGYDNNQDERPAGMVIDNSGNMYFAGSGKYLSSDKYYYDIFVGKVNSDGSQGWQNLYHSAYKDSIPDPGQNDESGGSANAIAIDDSGYIYVTGSVGKGSNSAFLALVMKIDPSNGNAVWQKYWFCDVNRLGYTDSAVAYAIDVSDGVVYITGEGKDTSTSTQGIYVTALSANNGSHKWSKIINPDGNSYKDRGYAVKADGKGNLYVAGWQGANTGSPFLCKLTNISSNPAIVWAKNFSMGTGCNFNSMDVDSSGNVYLSADRRGAQTFFTIVKVSPDGNTVISKTFPGTNGGLNNTYVVRVFGNSVYAGGRIGISGLDTGQGDGILVKLNSSDLSLDWAAVYYTGNGPQTICEHHLKGIGLYNNDLYLYGEVYTGNNNYFRYYGYWFDLPGDLENYSPEINNVSSTTTITDMSNAGLVDGSKNGGSYDSISSGMNVEFQDAKDKNEETHGSQVDGDVFFMKLGLD